ncbi:MAG: caspase family protein [Pseudomonadales bacterium]|nr:caspase family protein [Pseudomonadales bacterium]
MTRIKFISIEGQKQRAWFCSSLLSMFLASCANSPQEGATELLEQASRNADDLMIVDCLLPGQVRKLGAQASYLTARRPVKSTAADCEIRGGEYVAFDRSDYATALKVWLPQAQAGSAEAQNYVGEIYERGLGILPDYEAAAHWYKLAAEQKLSRSQINLGHLYEKGLGVEKDTSIALNWYRKASGLNTDKLQYASTVQAAHASQAELQALKDKSALQEKEKADLERQLRSSQKALIARETSLVGAQSALNDTTAKLKAAKQLLLDPSVSKEVQQAELIKLQEKINLERDRHDEELIAFTSETLALGKQRELVIAALEEELLQNRTQVEQQKQKITTLKNSRNRFSDNLQQLAVVDTTVFDAPIIEIIEPPMILTRGRATVKLRSAVKQREIIGKVLAPAGLHSLKINDAAYDLDKHNLFWVDMPILRSSTPVQVVAIDKEGRRVAMDFSFEAERLVGFNSAEASTVSRKQKTSVSLGRYYALVIGNNQYTHFPSLDTAVNDAKVTAELLNRKYGYKTVLLENADRYSILSALNKLRETLSEKDNLLVYYAGHGELDQKNTRGYWLPVDAEVDNTTNWISNVAITDILNAMPAKHVMVVADSCYAGTLSSTSMARPDVSMPNELKEEWIQIMSETRARTVLTSGGIAPVMDGGGGDHSVFAKAFIDTLEANEGVMEGHTLYRSVLSQVRSRSQSLELEQIPEYSPIRHAGHEAGEFFFQPVSI